MCEVCGDSKSLELSGDGVGAEAIDRGRGDGAESSEGDQSLTASQLKSKCTCNNLRTGKYLIIIIIIIII